MQAVVFFFFNDTAAAEIYTLSLHDALPIYSWRVRRSALEDFLARGEHSATLVGQLRSLDRKSTRLNSSHANISYAVFCLKKKNHVVVARVLTLSCMYLAVNISACTLRCDI